MRGSLSILLLGVATVTAPHLSTTRLVAGESDDASAILTFEHDIRPIFRAHCFDCHGAREEKEGELDLRLVRFLLRGGEKGPAIVAGQPDASLLLRRVRAGEMPPGDAKVSEEELELLERWIEAGAPTARPEPESIGPGVGISPEDRAFWSFRPVRRPVVTPVDDPRARGPIDAIITRAARRAASDGSDGSDGSDVSVLSPDADRRTLLHRVSLDLTGLPPTPAQVEAFLADSSPLAYEVLVDRLLASPRFGERWARHWLDVAGYADSEGYTTSDAVRPWAYKYRDWVVRAFNADKPFDRFLLEQLAGDELAGAKEGDWTAEQIDLLTATGFLRMAADGTGSGADTELARNQVVADTLKIVGSSLLGLSVACAQCHDHRYDPLPQRDYYALRAIFDPALDWKRWRTPQARRVSLYTEADRKRAAEVEAEAKKIAEERAARQERYLKEALEKELSKYEEPLRSELKDAYETPGGERIVEQKALLKKYPSVNITPGVLYQYNQKAADDLKSYDQRIAEMRAKKPVEEFVRALVEPPGPVPVTHRFHRGDHRQPREAIEPGVPRVLIPPGEYGTLPTSPGAGAGSTTGRRLAFARWLTGPENPITARVIANRVWMHLFGRGLVATPADFGQLGARPTHPELLDWLADTFRRDGWSLKRLIRRIVLSTAYRQSSSPEGDGGSGIAGNWCQSVRRLDAETLRDRMLAVNGRLETAMFGPAVPVEEDDTGQVIVANDSRRRTLYVQARRSRPVAMLHAFDAPVMETNCEHRASSTVATQSLILLNGDFVLKQAAYFAERVRREAAELVAAEDVADVSIDLGGSGSAWRYGYGDVDATSGRVSSFHSLPHWTGSGYQGGPKLPDPALGWVLVNARGGHPGRNPGFASIRRWIAPRDGRVAARGKLEHPSDQGDGVRGRAIAGRSGVCGTWVAAHGDIATDVGELDVTAGETVDFVVDCRDTDGYDGFRWLVELRYLDEPATRWDSAADFAAPETPLEPRHVVAAWKLAYGRPPSAEELPLALEFVERQMKTIGGDRGRTPLPDRRSAADQALTNLCQMLLISNEFLYVE